MLILLKRPKNFIMWCTFVWNCHSYVPFWIEIQRLFTKFFYVFKGLYRWNYIWYEIFKLLFMIENYFEPWKLHQRLEICRLKSLAGDCEPCDLVHSFWTMPCDLIERFRTFLAIYQFNYAAFACNSGFCFVAAYEKLKIEHIPNEYLTMGIKCLISVNENLKFQTLTT